MDNTFVIGAPHVRAFLYKVGFASWIGDTMQSNNIQSAKVVNTLPFSLYDALECHFTNQVTVNTSTGVEPVTVPGLPHPAIIGEVEVPPIDVTINILPTKSTLLNTLINTFQAGNYPNDIFHIVLVATPTRGGIYIQNCIPRSMSLQFNENLPTFSVTFTSNFLVLLPPNSIQEIPPLENSTPITPKLFSSILTEGGVSLRGLSILSLSMSVSNTIQAFHTIPFEDWDGQGLGRRAATTFSLGYQTGELTVRTFNPQTNTPLSLNTNIREISVEMYDSTMEEHIGTLILKGRYGGIRFELSPTGQGLIYDITANLGYETFWQFTAG